MRTTTCLLSLVLLTAPSRPPVDGSATADRPVPTAAMAPRHVAPVPELMLPYRDVGPWNVVAELRDPPSCLMLGRFPSGKVIRVGVDRNGPPMAYAVVGDPAWRGIRADADQPVDLAFGTSPAVRVVARSGPAGTMPSLTIPLADAAVARAFATASDLAISVDGRTVAHLALESTMKGLAAVAACQTEVDGIMADPDPDPDDGEAPPRAAPVA